VNEISRERRLLAAAVACGLFVICLFLPWYGAGPIDLSGDDVVPSFWIFLLIALAAGLIMAAEALNVELPQQIRPVPQAALLTSFPLVVTVAIFLEGTGGASRRYGLWGALLFAIIAFAIAVWLWREERE
jgi:hypothetical protein